MHSSQSVFKNPIQGLFKDSKTTFTIFKDHCTNPKQHFYKHVYTGLVYISNFTHNVRLSTTKIKTGVTINSYQMHNMHKLHNYLSLNPIILQIKHVLKTAHCIRKPNSNTFNNFLAQIQGLLRTLSLFKDFPGLENLKKF